MRKRRKPLWKKGDVKTPLLSKSPSLQLWTALLKFCVQLLGCSLILWRGWFLVYENFDTPSIFYTKSIGKISLIFLTIFIQVFHLDPNHSYLSIEQLECKFTPNLFIFKILAAYKNTHIKNMRTYTISYFHIRIKVRNKQCINIQTFVLNIAGIFYQVPQKQERSFISEMRTNIFTGRVIPASIQ